ncbi:hypothetical protein ACFWBB_28505 [Streptomyces sp. NPDC060000]
MVSVLTQLLRAWRAAARLGKDTGGSTESTSSTDRRGRSYGG